MSDAALTLPPDAACLDCGYQLIGLTVARCPECGREFEPSDPFTYRTASRPRRIGWVGSLRRRLPQRDARLRVEGRVVLVIALIDSLIPFGNVFGLRHVRGLGDAPGFIFYATLLLGWFGFAGLALSRLERARRRWNGLPVSPAKPVGGWWGWQIWLVVILSAVMPATATVLLYAQWPMFNRAADKVEAMQFTAKPPPRYVGLVWVSNIQKCPHGTYFAIRGASSFWPLYAVLYRNNGTADHTCMHPHGSPLGGGWHVR